MSDRHTKQDGSGAGLNTSPPRRCSTCVHWKPVKNFDGWVPDAYKACKRQFTAAPPAPDGREIEAETVWLHDNHIDPRCEMFTGPRFGCVHHLSNAGTQVSSDSEVN